MGGAWEVADLQVVEEVESDVVRVSGEEGVDGLVGEGVVEGVGVPEGEDVGGWVGDYDGGVDCGCCGLGVVG